MKNSVLTVLFLSFLLMLSTLSPTIQAAAEDLNYYSEKDQTLAVEWLGRYASKAPIDDGGTEIVAYDPNTYYGYSVNGSEKTLDIIDLSVLANGDTEIPLVKKIKLSDFGVDAGDLTSVTIDPESRFIAVSVPAENKVDNGHIVFLSTEGDVLTSVEVGALPDMVSITPNGNKVLVANEGEPSEDYAINPEGTVSIIDISNGIEKNQQLSTETARFTEKIVEDDVRKVHPGSSYPENLEPEYIVVDQASQYGYVVLQESNAIAKLDIATGEFLTVKSLGYKDFSLEQNKLDASDKDDMINIRNWPVLSIYQPDGMDIINIDGKSYILTANEGDAQDWDGFSEEERVNDLKGDYQLNADLYDGYTQEELDRLVENGLFDNEQLGRLKTSISHPVNEEGKYEAIYGYGGRSFSIWDANSMELVYDSGSDFENKIATFQPDYFHSNNDEDTFESRSDDKGVEPESVITGKVNGTNYAFIGLERQGGIMVYDLTNLTSPQFENYFSSRHFNGQDEEVTSASGDVAPEGLTFIPENQSPTGKSILLAAHEVSGTIAAYEIGVSSDSTISELTVDHGKLSPGFSSDTFDYSMEVANDIEHIHFSAITNSANTNVLINGNDPDKGVALDVGDNEVVIEAVAEDGSSSSYVVQVKRLASSITDDLQADGNNLIFETDISYLDNRGELILNVPDKNESIVNIIISAEQLQLLKDKDVTVKVQEKTVRLAFDLESFSAEDALTLTIKQLDEKSIENAEFARSDLFDFEFVQANQSIASFESPVTLSFKLAEHNDILKIYNWKGSTEKWEKVGGLISGDWIEAEADHFSIFAVFKPEDLLEKDKVSSEDNPEPSQNEKDPSSERINEDKGETPKTDLKNNTLPDTATNMYTILLIGGLLLILGMVLVVLRKNKKFTNE
ncbi:choice-of-anchor I family protein [Gracilibacillus kekensis]|uniref:LPXTG-motif cell wall anchor domain-containing protein n=1 Tax=Gracilibacillus kekensis TaxID=1027249 RepID=A0A1M7JI17_9BACI|nr:choice-of-anchor I family protein [Gracilibacillus kekensis]SHM52720.1 LPXTG-motif cell wall anchor domain-containing protein [Gracilibacillus kekensis]